MLYERPPDEAELASLGLLPADMVTAAIELWECNRVPVEVFRDMGTQWRVGPVGPTGLDYGALPTVLRIRSISRQDWPDLFNDLRVLEQAAIDVIYEGRK